jgi:hypothetical protein
MYCTVSYAVLMLKEQLGLRLYLICIYGEVLWFNALYHPKAMFL